MRKDHRTDQTRSVNIWPDNPAVWDEGPKMIQLDFLSSLVYTTINAGSNFYT